MSAALLETLVKRPHAAGIFLDFDGTLSEIVPIPSEARPAHGVADLLVRLSRAYRVVAIVSGRGAAELVGWLGPELEIWGVHGAERSEAGAVIPSPGYSSHVDLMQRVHVDAAREMAEAGLEGSILENKGVVLTLHYRAARDREAAAAALAGMAERLAARHGIDWVAGKMSFELRPPVPLSKAGVVLARARAEGLDTVLFAGDDVVDLPAFDALDELERAGARAVRVAVAAEETPRELLERADLVVDGVAGAIALLEWLAPPVAG